jgi:hypothetical protein
MIYWICDYCGGKNMGEPISRTCIFCKKERGVVETYSNAGDCEHGRQRGKCPECKVIDLESRITRLKALCGEAGKIIARYHDETPHGHQPHMIVRPAEEILKRLKDEGVDV